MNYRFIIIFLLSFNATVSSQVSGESKFKVSAGIEYRITPYGIKEGIFLSDFYYITNSGRQLSGVGINLNVEYDIFENISIGLMQNIRKDEVYADINVTNGQIMEYNRRFIYDFGIFTRYYLPLRNDKNKFFGTVGLVFMNNNTRFTAKKTTHVFINEIPVLEDSEVNLNFNSLLLGIGYRVNNFDFMLGNYFVSKSSDPFENSQGLGIPFIRANYTFLKF